MDELTVRKAVNGDKLSFSNDAYRIAYCYLNNAEDSMDAVCDAVEKALRNIRTLREPGFFKTWFIRIVINECKIQLRKRKTVIFMADKLYKDESYMSDAKEEAIDLQELLKKLEPLDRLLIYMKYYLGYTLEEIAGTVNLPPGTVKSRIYRNLKSLRIYLEIPEGGGRF